MGKDPKTHEDMIVAANKTEWTYTRHLTADGLVYILTQVRSLVCPFLRKLTFAQKRSSP